MAHIIGRGDGIWKKSNDFTEDSFVLYPRSIQPACFLDLDSAEQSACFLDLD